MEIYENYIYSNDIKELEDSIKEILKNDDIYGYKNLVPNIISAIWNTPFNKENSSFIIAIDNFTEGSCIYIYKNKELSVLPIYVIDRIEKTDHIKIFDHDNYEYNLNFIGTISDEVCSKVYNDMKNILSSVLTKMKKYLNIDLLEKRYKNGMLTPEEYNNLRKFIQK